MHYEMKLLGAILYASLFDFKNKKMSPPIIQVNTFVTKNKKPQVDLLSKIFIVPEMILGLYRSPLLGSAKFIYAFITFIIQVVWNGMVIYVSLAGRGMNTMMWNKIIQHNICAMLSFTRCNWMLAYYSKLRTFDSQAACKTKTTTSSIRNAAFTGLVVFFLTAIFLTYSGLFINSVHFASQFYPLHLVYIIEVYYYGHLLSLLVPRLKLINYYIESSLTCDRSEPHPIFEVFSYIKQPKVGETRCQMGKLMDLYEVVVEAYDFLMEAIKWQLLLIIISGFTSILGFLYMFCLNTFSSGEMKTVEAIVHIGMTLVLMIPLFSPCTFANSVHSEVKKLRALLASKLYEKKLDKSSRSIARALLAYSQTRDLSFRLLRMINIDISLPFKFLGLIVTYLIILLQFQKVINP